MTQLISNIICIILIIWFFVWFCNFFCPLQCFRPFFTILVIFKFFKIVKNVLLLTPSHFQCFNISTKQNFLSKKKSRSMPLRCCLGAKKNNNGNFFTWTPRVGNWLCLYDLIFHTHIEENSSNHIYFIKKIILSSDFREIWKLRFLTLQ